MTQQYLLHSKVFLAANKNSYKDIEQLRNSFDRFSFSIERTDSFKRAIRALQSDQHDIYVVDFNLEPKDGQLLLDAIDERGQKSNVVLIVDKAIKASILQEISRRSAKYIFNEDFTAKKLETLIHKIQKDAFISNKLPEGKKRYKKFIENLPVMFYAVEPESPFLPIYISPEFECLGYPLAKWKDSRGFWMEVLHPEDRGRVLLEIDAAMKSGSDTDFEYRIIKSDGSVCWIRDQGRFTKSESGELICWQGVMVEITEQKRAENLLRESEARYRQMFEGNRSVKLIVDVESLQIVNANPAACNYYGFSAEEFADKKFTDISINNSEATFEQLRNSNKSPENYFTSKHRLASGEERDIEMFANSLTVSGKNYFYVVVYDITERKEAEEALVKSEKRYRDLFENANDLIYVHDLFGNYISVNNAGEKIFGYTREESLKMNFSQIIAPESLEYARQMTAAKLAGEKESVYEIDCIGKDDKKVALEINSKLVFKDGKPIAVQGIARDITERKQAEDDLIESEKRFRDLFENANDLIYTHDLEGNFTSLNRTGEIITGYSREEALKMNIGHIVAPEFLERAKQMIAQKVSNAAPTSYELDIVTKSGERVTLDLSTRLILKNGIPFNVQGIARNVTERKKTEEQLQWSALYDPLTELPNRTNFMHHLAAAVSASESESRSMFAVLFLDLDRFKVINDSLGHAVGDKLLIAIAEKLKDCVRPQDVIARLGGDEFTILLSINDESDAIHVAERIQEILSLPIKLDNYEVFTSASIGIIISNEITRTPQDVLRDADSAMYQAKETGKARYEIFDNEMHVRNVRLLQLETDLRRAIERNEFELYYQPIVELESGQISELEALIRWNHPEHGLVMPDRFISVAEETGLIIPIGDWVLRESCKQLKKWQYKYDWAAELSVSVNLSAKQLMHPNLTTHVARIIELTGLDARHLKLEVTESMVMEHSERAESVLKQLQALGVSLSTDDFGTGYSSLSYLHQYPFDRLKIDRTFIAKMDSDVKSEAIVRTILMLGRNLEIEVTAEGIENEHQMWQLRSLGCKRGQGYLFSKPVDRRAIAKLMKNSQMVNMGSLESPVRFLSQSNGPA